MKTLCCLCYFFLLFCSYTLCAYSEELLKIIHVQATKKDQNIIKSRSISKDKIEPIIDKGGPKTGMVLLIIECSFHITTAPFEFSYADDLYLIDGSGEKVKAYFYDDAYGAYEYGGSWKHGWSNKGDYKKKLLFGVLEKHVKGSKLHFMGNDYPVESRR